MKTITKEPILGVSGVLTAAVLLLTSNAQAGTVNVDCQINSGTVATQGILPAGPTWNELDKNATTFPLKSDNNVTLPSTGTASGAVFTSVDPGANPIQADSISSSGGGEVSVNIYGLRPGKYYKLVVYSSADNPGSSTVAIAGGPSKTTNGTATNPASVSNMVEGRDYVVFESLKAGAGGDIGFAIQHPILTKLAGFQLQGWLENELFPHKTDVQVSKKKGNGYKGNDQYTGNQRQTIRGKRSAKFYFRLQNDGNVCGTYGAKAKGSDRNANRKYFDVTGGRKNVTAKIKSGKYRTSVSPNQYATIQAIIKPKGNTRKVTTVLRGTACDNPSPDYGDKNRALVTK